MPEGDTIWRTARTLDAALAGRAVTAFRSSRVAVDAAARRLGVVGRRVEAVEARGKHLLVRFEGGAALHSHLGMQGGWRLVPAPPLRVPASAGAVVETAEVAAVLTLAPVVEVLSAAELARHPALGRLGPDLLDPDFDPADALGRLRERGELPIGVALLDQTALAGIGNVYKSEVLFVCGVSPLVRVRDVDDATLDRLVRTARDLLRRNLRDSRRRTTSALAPGPLWVYRRSGQPCRRCGSPVGRVVQGEQARSTYWCRTCQR